MRLEQVSEGLGKVNMKSVENGIVLILRSSYEDEYSSNEDGK